MSEKSSLTKAIENNNFEKTVQLINQGKRPTDAHFDYAACHGFLDILILLDKINPELATHDILNVAALCNQLAIVKYLVETCNVKVTQVHLDQIDNNKEIYDYLKASRERQS